MNEQQAQGERRQTSVRSLRQNVELGEATESAVVEGRASDEPIEKMATDELENESI